MSFGSEFRQMRSGGGSPKITEEVSKEAEAAIAKKLAEAPPEVDPDAAIYSQPHVDGQALEAAPETQEELVIPPPKPDVKKTPVKIGNKTFDTVEEAMAFAENEFNEAEKSKAYVKGKEDALKPAEVVKPAEKKKILKIAEKLFENPDEAFEELEAHFAEMADKRAEARDNQKSEVQLKADQIKKDVDNFYKENSDLADWQDEVNLVCTKNNAYLMGLPKDKIASEAARLSREYVESVKERALPRQTLPSKAVVTPSGGAKSTTATNIPATQKSISFAQQVRSTNRRTASAE